MNHVPVVVTPLDEHMGLDIARSLGKKGIPVFGLDPDPQAVGRASRYCQLVVCPDPTKDEHAYVQFLIEFTQKQEQKPVLYPLSDETALLIAKEQNILRQHYQFLMPSYPQMVSLGTKAELAEAAKACGIGVPETYIPKNLDDVHNLSTRVNYPVILKPVEGAYWHVPQIASLLRENPLSGRAKVVQCHTPAELLNAYKKIATQDDRMVIQEVIPGPDENLSYISFYLNRASEPLAIFAGRKHRVIPIGFGSASYVRSFYDPALVEVALKLLTSVKYQGLGGLEFKKDANDGQYKLVEFNVRFGMWDGLGSRCGVDTPFIAYQDTLGHPVEPQHTYRQGVIWVDWQRDIRAFWMYRRHKQLTFGQWLKSLRGEKMWAIYTWDDWRPGLLFTWQLLVLFLRRIVASGQK